MFHARGAANTYTLNPSLAPERPPGILKHHIGALNDALTRKAEIWIPNQEIRKSKIRSRIPANEFDRDAPKSVHEVTQELPPWHAETPRACSERFLKSTGRNLHSDLRHQRTRKPENATFKQPKLVSSKTSGALAAGK